MDDKPQVKRPYHPPVIRVLDEQEMLAQFQLTSAATGWWF